MIGAPLVTGSCQEILTRSFAKEVTGASGFEGLAAAMTVISLESAE